MSLLTRISHDLLHPSPWEPTIKMHSQHDYLVGFRSIENLVTTSLTPSTSTNALPDAFKSPKPPLATTNLATNSQQPVDRHPALAPFMAPFRPRGKKLLKSDHQLIYKSYFENRPIRTSIIRNPDRKGS